MKFPAISRIHRFATVRYQLFCLLFDGRTLRGLAPGIIAVALAPWLVAAIRLELATPLFSDTLVFQYSGWCLRHGLRLYRDFGMADGPFIHYLHAAIQVFVGLDDRAFRRADLFLHVVGAGSMGALLAPASAPRRAARWANRVAWAATAATIWLSWYFTFRWEDTTQRESFYSLFGSLGMVILFSSGRYGRRASQVALFTGAFLTATQVFGKPTGVMYTAAGALCILLPDANASLTLRTRWRVFVAGVGACVFAVVLALLVSGSFSGYLHWCIRIPYRGNRFLYGLDWHRLLFTTYWDRYSRVVVVAFIAGVGSVGSGLLPARALPFAFVPPLAFLGACLQARGFPYHPMPAMAGTATMLLLIVTSLWNCDEQRGGVNGQPLIAACVLSFVGYYCLCNIQEGPFRWNGDPTKWDQSDARSGDNEKTVGEYIKAHTKADDLVFAYSPGDAHIVLFRAERRTASPFFHAYWLDPVALLSTSEIKPNEAELAALTELQADNRRMACKAVMRNRPAALAFNPLQAAFEICPDLRTVTEEFGAPTVIAGYSVFLRKPTR